VKAQILVLCEWTILVTNLSTEQLTVLQAHFLLRLRWQIELLFKLWKQSLSLDVWRSKQAFQIMSEVYAKLFLSLINHWLRILASWEEERSLVKASYFLKKQAFQLLSLRLTTFSLNSVLVKYEKKSETCYAATFGSRRFLIVMPKGTRLESPFISIIVSVS
jgi:hypothetical protein